MDITYYKKYEPVFNEWKIVREIGEGSFGKVFELERVDDFNGDIYRAALKAITIPQNESEIDSIMDNGLDQDSVTTYFRGVVDEFIEEFKLMSKLEGESNIVSYKGHRVIPHENKVGWDILIQMELLTPLLKHTKEHPLGREDVISLGIDMCKALELCRKHNIIHRDIKPENIFISNNGQYKLGDFGIAKTVEKTTGGLSKKGTYTYMAPEVYKGEKYGPSVDIYSLGIVLYRYLNNNRAPFLPPPPSMIKHTDTNTALERRIIIGEEIPAPANADEELAAVILKACAYNPKDRFSSPTEMREALEAAAKSAAVIIAEPPAIVTEDDDKTVGIFDSVKPAATENPSEAGTVPDEPALIAKPDTSEEKTVAENPTEADSPEEVTAKENINSDEDRTTSIQGIAVPIPVKPEPVKSNPEPVKKKAPKAAPVEPKHNEPEKKKKKKAPAIIAAVLLLAIITGAFGFGYLGGPGYQEDWTEWSEELPRGVDGDDYIVEEQLMYRSRDKQVKEAADKTDMDGWTYDGSADSGEYGAWSEWSTEKPADAEGREIETETRYRTRNLETTTGSSSSKSGWTLADTTYTWGSYGSWSSWSTTKPTASDSRKVETKTQYSYRTKSTTSSSSSSLSGWTRYDSSTTYGEYGAWSGWSNSYIASSNTRQVDTRWIEPTYRTEYNYSRYNEYNLSTSGRRGWNGPTKGSWGGHYCQYYEERGWSTDSLSQTGSDSGYAIYGGNWYNQQTRKVEVSSGYTQYRYRDRSAITTYYFYKWSSWSSYSDSYQSSSRTKEVRTRTVYRYCDRSKIPTYHFERWGDWSDWSTQKANPNSTKQVEEQTFYRYRDKLDEKVYIYYRWSDWSDWTATPIEESDENDVESQTMYRFKSR